jgi:maleate isomerase
MNHERIEILMKKLRVGMIVPSLNTIAEDDFRRFCPDDVAYHVHRIRLRKEAGRVTMASLTRAHLEAVEEASFLKDMSPDAVAFNCTGASVAYGPGCDAELAQRMTAELGIPSGNTMVAIKEALRALEASHILHVCPFTDEFSRVEHQSLVDSGFGIERTISLDFVDAKVAALMEPQQIADFVRERIDGSIKSVLLSCANVRSFEAASALEETLDMPVVTSNQAMLWSVLKLAGWKGHIPGAGRLFNLD